MNNLTKRVSSAFMNNLSAVGWCSGWKITRLFSCFLVASPSSSWMKKKMSAPCGDCLLSESVRPHWTLKCLIRKPFKSCNPFMFLCFYFFYPWFWCSWLIIIWYSCIYNDTGWSLFGGFLKVPHFDPTSFSPSQATSTFCTRFTWHGI